MIKRPYHIAYIGQKGIPARWGGVERATEELAVRVAAAGHLVTAYCRPWYGEHRPMFHHGIRLKYVSSIHTKHLDAITHAFFSLINALWNRVDVVHFQGTGPALLAWIPRVLTPRTRVFVTVHCLDRTLRKWNWFARFAFFVGEWIAVRSAHELFVTSRGLQTYVLQEWRRDAVFLPNGVFADAAHASTEHELAAFSLTAHQFVVCVGRFMFDKAQHEAIEAFVRMKDRACGSMDEIKLVLVGDASSDNALYRDALLELAAHRNDIIFAGVQTGARLRALMAYARAGVSLSYSEGMPLAVLELAASGVPLVLSDIDAHREIFGDLHAFIPLGDIERASTQLELLVSRFADIRNISAIIGERVREQYRWDVIAARYGVSLVNSVRGGVRTPETTTAGNELFRPRQTNSTRP